MALIKGKQLVAGTIDTRELKDSAVTNAKINDTEITSAKLNISGEAWDFSGASSLSAPAPTAAGHVATKGYADSVAQGLDVKESVRSASTTDLDGGNPGRFNFSNGVFTEGNFINYLPIGGITPVVGDRVLLKDQTEPEENGIYEITAVGNGSTISWRLERADDANTSDKLNNGAFVFVGQGSNAGAGFVLTTPDPITLNTTELTFSQFSGAGQLTGGDGVEITGNTISLDLAAAGALEIDTAQLSLKVEDASLVLSANGVKVQHNGNSTATDTNGIKAAVPSSDKLNLTPLAVSIDGGSTGISLSNAPADGSRVDVSVNGVGAAVGNGVKTLDCYFSSDSGATAKSFAALTAGDVLYWNGSSVYALDTDDRVSVLYNGAL